MKTFVRGHLRQLEELPTALLSVSLAEASAEDQTASPDKRARARVDVKKGIDTFLLETGWQPSQIGAVAGALMYLKYNFLVRFVMKRIARTAGGPTDASRNYEFTDWATLGQMVNGLVQIIPAAPVFHSVPEV
jgi:menaquinone-dependent protoporphyrinogen oxidase